MCASGGSPIISITVQVSYDDNAAWQDAALTGGPRSEYQATVHHPAAADTDGFVSLKMNAVDADGNSTVQTLNHAYALKG
ncbi:hypothetical protein [Peterkaempfera sp. SMS 1(5)a]|uniref:hypothetical protein n=1 Tax=Peterkaempfera podocarpi TaxID=3232308 RepID=UPI00366EE22A